MLGLRIWSLSPVATSDTSYWRPSRFANAYGPSTCLYSICVEKVGQTAIAALKVSGLTSTGQISPWSEDVSLYARILLDTRRSALLSLNYFFLIFSNFLCDFSMSFMAIFRQFKIQLKRLFGFYGGSKYSYGYKFLALSSLFGQLIRCKIGAR